MSRKENFFVYRFLDENQETLYVGKTKNLTGRIRSTHFSKLGHLPDECYSETKIVVYSECLSESDMAIQERYLINTLNPKYNDKMNRSDTFSFTINCFDWKYLPFVRPEEKVKKNPEPEPFASCLPAVSVQTKPLVVPSLGAAGTLSMTRDYPGDLYNLYSFGAEFEPLRGLWMNGELWLSALSICEFSFVSMANDQSSKMRVVQFIKKQFLSCDDVCIVENKAFCRSDYRSSVFGKLRKAYPSEERMDEESSGVLIRTQALEGFVSGLLENYTRDKKKRLDQGISVKAFYRSTSGDFPTKRCKTFDEYCNFMAGPNRTNPNLFSVAYRISKVCDALKCIGTT